MTSAQFKRERERIGLSQARLAQRIGVSRSAVIRWEHGDVPISHPVALLMRMLPTEKGGATQDH